MTSTPDSASAAAGPSPLGARAAAGAVYTAAVLLAGLLAYVIVTAILHLVGVTRATNVLGAMWAIISAVFVIHTHWTTSRSGVRNRMLATVVAVVVSGAWLLVAPATIWATCLLAAAAAGVCTLIRRPELAITAAITVIVIVQAAQLSSAPQSVSALLRAVDTLAGCVAGLGVAALTGLLGRYRPDLARLTP